MLVCVKLKITRTIGKYGCAATNLVVFLHGFCVAYSLVSICQVIGWERWVFGTSQETGLEDHLVNEL